jgi:hypothetical protein
MTTVQECTTHDRQIGGGEEAMELWNGQGLKAIGIRSVSVGQYVCPPILAAQVTLFEKSIGLGIQLTDQVFETTRAKERIGERTFC